MSGVAGVPLAIAAVGSGGGGGGGGSPTIPFTNAGSTSFTADTTSHSYLVSQGGVSTVTLPTSTSAVGQMYFVSTAGGTQAFLAPTGSDNINGVNNTLYIPPNSTVVAYSDGVDGYFVGNYVTLSNVSLNQLQYESDGLSTGQLNHFYTTPVASGDDTNLASNGFITFNLVTASSSLSSLTLELPNLSGSAYPVPIMYITITQAVTSLTFSGNVSSAGLPLTASTTSAQTFMFVIPTSGGEWTRVL
jgi:hypothetical protein